MRSACATALVLAPLVLCILGLALYPQLILKRTAPTVAADGGEGDRRRALGQRAKLADSYAPRRK